MTLLFLLLSIIPAASKSIWFIRHCDKPHRYSSCCSDVGYERANHWHNYFLPRIHLNQPLAIYTSGFSETRACVNISTHLSTYSYSCQKSQRMYLTALAINQNIPSSTICSKYYRKSRSDSVDISQICRSLRRAYCIGDYRRLLHDINLSTSEQILVVWEHTEIVDMIRAYGIDMPKWRNHFNDLYNIVFHLEFDAKNTPTKFTYDLYDFRTNRGSHSREVDEWLRSTQILSEPTPTPLDHHNLFLPILFVSAFLFILSSCIYLCNLARHRRGYTMIV